MRVVGDGEVVGVDRIHRRLTRTRARCARRGARQDREFHAGTDGALRAARLHDNGRDLARKVLRKLRAKPPSGGGGSTKSSRSSTEKCLGFWRKTVTKQGRVTLKSL